ncbi:HaaA family cyclophane-containing RiPP peptide [Streptomyces sp. NPDC086080]|uniref:HaaA family cyclophane-containing RiPP peptide n=1 Tax=Streptomyces sp. NPDC086080 TaxID=3365748 RepID=UPI0037CDA6E6
MLPDSPISTEHAATEPRPHHARDATVLDRVASRVRQRLETEQATATRAGDGGHAASLILPWPM